MEDVINQIWPEWHAEKLLGQGSYGKVYRAVRKKGDHVSRSAVKVIEIPQSHGEVTDLVSAGMDELSIRSYFESRARGVLDEVALMEELKGAPNVVSIEDYQLKERDDGVGWTVLIRMPLLESLFNHFVRSGMPDAQGVALMGDDLCRALSACHAKGVIHRDVKPENIFYNEYGYQLGDFGIARRLGTGARSAHTRAGAFPYMAPEVFAGKSYGPNVDIYSLGLVLYRLLNNGRAPFLPAEGAFGPADDERATALRLAGKPLPAPANADEALAAIVLRACDPDPEKRFASADAMGAALRGWLVERSSGTVCLDADDSPLAGKDATSRAAAIQALGVEALDDDSSQLADQIRRDSPASAGPSGTVRATTQDSASGSIRVTFDPNAATDIGHAEKKPWYVKTWAVVLFLLVFWPVGLVFMWNKKCAWPKTAKMVVTAALAVLLAIAVVGRVAGCSHDPEPQPGVGSISSLWGTDSSPDSQTPADTGSSPGESAFDEEFVVGFDQDYPPYGFPADDGSYTGFDLELAQEVCRRNGWDYVAQPIGWDQKDTLLNNGEIDCFWSGFQLTPERTDAYALSEPYIDNSLVIVVRADSSVSQLSDLNGCKVVAQTDSWAMDMINAESEYNFDFAPSSVEGCSDYNTAFAMLGSGETDAVACDLSTADYEMERNPGSYSLLDERLTDEKCVVAFAAGNEELASQVSDTLRQMDQDGFVEDLCEKYADSGISYNQWILK